MHIDFVMCNKSQLQQYPTRIWVCTYKYLGVYIDSNLKFRDHIYHVVKKLNKFCGLIYRVRYVYPIKCLMSFYNAYARSVICYDLLVNGSAARTNLEKIEMAQSRIIRAILFKKSMTVYKIFCGKPSSIQFLNCSLWMYSERSLIS